MDAKQLSILLDVARLGSFSAAARHRNVSQPAISLAISQMERQLGQQLLERGRRGVTATPAGRILVRRAEALENQLALAEAEVRLDARGIGGPLRIAGTPGALISLVPGAVARLLDTHPAFALTIAEAPDAQLLDLLRSEAADLAVGTLGFATAEDVIEIDLLSDGFELVVRAEHGLKRVEVELAELAEAPWILPNVGGAFRRQVDALFLTAGVTPPLNVIRCDSLATTKEIVRRTDYLTLLPQRVVATEVARGVLRAMPLTRRLSRRLGLRLLKRSYSAPLAQAFIAAAREAAAEA